MNPAGKTGCRKKIISTGKGSIAMRLILLTFLAFLVLSVFLGAHKVYAQENESDMIVVEGRILRPQAAYIIQRARADFGIEAKKRSFLPKIEASINEEPFK